MNLTITQKVALLMITLNVLAGGSAQLTPLFGDHITQMIASASALAGTIIGGWVFVLTGQQNIVKQVADMAGVERISVNANANQALAQVAVDPEQPKVGAVSPDAREVLKTTAAVGS